MRRPSKRQLAILVVGLAVVLAGCSGGGGGDGNGDGGATTATATPTQTADPGGNGNTGDGATDTATATATATMTDGGTTTDDGGGGTTNGGGDTATATKTSTGTPSGGDSEAEAHQAALQEAGSYTLRVEATSLGTTSRGGTVTDVSTSRLTGSQKTNVATGETYAEWSVGSSSSSFEYYVPPNSDTAFQNIGGRTREVSADETLLFEFARITDPDSETSTQLVTNFSAYGEAGTGSTPLGPATKYVIDDADDLPADAIARYDEIKSVEMTLWVDKDTGIIAKYQYQYTIVLAGEEVTLDGLINIEDIGSTTIEKPDWVPE